jgi:sugar lactone lactonase YvrE
VKAQFNSFIRAACHSFSGAACAGAFLLISTSAPAQILFESDAASQNIFEFTPNGTQSTFVSGIYSPEGLAFDSAGNLFVARFWLNTITEIKPDGSQSTFASGLDHPGGLAFDSAGNLFEADLTGGYIYEFTPGGVQSTFASGVYLPNSLAFDSAGNLFVGTGGGNVYKFTPGGGQSIVASGLNGPVAFDGAGNLFIGNTGSSSSSIIRITPGGVQSTFVSINNYDVMAIAFNNTGDLFAAVSHGYGYNDAILEITPGGVVSTFKSGLDSPFGLAFQGGPLPVPEPSVLRLLAFGIFGLTFLRRRQG